MKRHFNILPITRFLHWFRITPQPHLQAGMLFFVLTIGMTFPLVTQLNTHVPPGQQATLTVPYLNLWTLAWNHRWLSNPSLDYWNANSFYPHRKTIAYSEPQFATGLLTLPLVLFGGNTILTYNVALLVFFWAAAMTTYALCWWLLGSLEEHVRNQISTQTLSSGRWLGSVTAGIFYGFHFYLFREIEVLQLLATFLLPLTLLGIHRFFHQQKWSDILLSSTGFIGAWYTCAYYGLFLTVFMPCFAIRLGRRDLLCRKVLTKLIAILILLFISLMPLIHGMWAAKTTMGLDRPEFIVRNLSAIFNEYLKLPHHSWLYGSVLETIPGKSLFLGNILLSLASLGIIFLFRSTSKKTNTVLKEPELQMHQYGKFYVLMAILAFLLSLGKVLVPDPSMDLGIYQFLVWLSPYNLLYQFLPGFSSIRSPDRFYVFVVLFMTILAGYGLFWISTHVHPRWRRILVPLLIIVAILEMWPRPLKLVKVPSGIEELPRIYAQVRKLPADSVLLELPTHITGTKQELEIDARYMYFSTFHWHALANGYSGFAPQASIELMARVFTSTPENVFSCLKAFGVEYILAHTDQLSNSEKAHLRHLKAKGLKLLYREGNDFLYQVDSGNITTPKQFPDTAKVKIYESQRSRSYVTLCFYYQVASGQCVLTTPWQNPIEFEVAWYRDTELERQHKPSILRSQEPYRGSKLITLDSNALEIEVPAPPPGKYEVSVRQYFGPQVSQRFLRCQIHKTGFVTFHGEK